MVSIQSFTGSMAPIRFPFVDVDCASDITSVADLAPDLSDPSLALLGSYTSLGVCKRTMAWKVLAVLNPSQIKSLSTMNCCWVKDVVKTTNLVFIEFAVFSRLEAWSVCFLCLKHCFWVVSLFSVTQVLWLVPFPAPQSRANASSDGPLASALVSPRPCYLVSLSTWLFSLSGYEQQLSFGKLCTPSMTHGIYINE